jgi:hypothetical protein
MLLMKTGCTINVYEVGGHINGGQMEVLILKFKNLEKPLYLSES